MRRGAVLAIVAGMSLSVGGGAACRVDTGGVPLDGDDDPDGGIQPPLPDADPAAPDAPTTCTTDETACVGAGVLQVCRGGMIEHESCTQGCVPTPVPHCKGATPSNGVDLGLLTDATAMFEVPGGATYVFDTGTGVIFDCGSGQFTRSAGEGVQNGIHFKLMPGVGGARGLGVFAMRSFKVKGGGTAIAIGPNGLVLLVEGEARIDEELLAGGGGSRCTIEAACGFQPGEASCPGPGGFPGGAPGVDGQGPGAGERGDGGTGAGQIEGGGGGAGHGAMGGAGGGDAGGGAGVVYGNRCEPLFGGSGGGGGGTDASATGTPGGGGGGAVQITSLTLIHFGGKGVVEVGGGGGAAGPISAGAGGGGSGGTILLEAPLIELDGNIAANGGGGGGGAGINPDMTPEQPGAPGGLTTAPAEGGNGTFKGGQGGAAGGVATSGQPPGAFDATSGGGGGVGRVCMRTEPDGLVMGSVVLSPTPVTSEDFVR
jgi:hypothetical protein